MKPHTYYRLPNGMVGLADEKGRFQSAVFNQMAAETEFHRQRVADAAHELAISIVSARMLAQAADSWRGRPGALLKLVFRRKR